jgi:hypothetical protein
VSKHERDFIEKLRSTSIHATAEVMEGLQRLRELHDELVDDGSGAPPPRPRLGDHFYQLAKLELEHAASVLRLGHVQAEMLFDHVRQLARRSRRGETPARILELVPDGDGHAGHFEVRNPFDRPADVRFEISELRDNHGREGFTQLPQVDCRTTPIPPRGVARIDVTLTDAVTSVLFGKLDVFLSGDVEELVARRSVKVRHG